MWLLIYLQKGRFFTKWHKSKFSSFSLWKCIKWGRKNKEECAEEEGLGELVADEYYERHRWWHNLHFLET